MTGPEISAIPREARAFQGEAAGIVSRVVANTVDAVLVGVVIGGCYLGWVAVVFLLDPRTFTWPTTRWVVVLTAALAFATAYLTLAWWLAAGRSYGDHVMGLRVVGLHGHRLGPLRSLMRAAFCVFFPIGLFWCVVSPRRRSVQDIVLWTKVVYDWTPRVSELGRRGGDGAVGGPVVESVVIEEASPAAGADAGAGAPPVAGPGTTASTDPPHVDSAAGSAGTSGPAGPGTPRQAAHPEPTDHPQS